MQLHKLIQGSPEWLEHRANHDNASEAAAMLGISRNTNRNELIKLKATGTTKEFSDFVQERVLDKGHAAEIGARLVIEEMLGQDLYPAVVSEGTLSASLDGMTARRKVLWETKQWNEEYAEMVRNNELPEEHWPQCQQALMITKADVLIFSISNGTKEHTVTMEVYPDQEKFDQLQAGWAQFHKDVDSYVPTEYKELPKAEAIEQLPVVSVQAKGELVTTNWEDVKPRLDTFLSSQKTALITDEDFANGEATGKLCRETAVKLKLTAQSVIDQIVDISKAHAELTNYAQKFNDLGLKLEKLVDSEKKSRKSEIIANAKEVISAYIAELETETQPVRIVGVAFDYDTPLKAKRTIESLHNAMDTYVANCKIKLSEVAKALRINIAHLNEQGDYKFLFNDLQQVAYKSSDDFKLLVKSRIDEHKQAKAKKLEDFRAQIAAEEKVKAEAKAQAQQAAEVKPEPKLEVKAEPAKAVAKPSLVKSSPQPTDIVTAFMNSREWPSTAIRHSSRAAIVEFLKFQEQQLEAA